MSLRILRLFEPSTVTRHRIKAEFAQQEVRGMSRIIEIMNPIEGGKRYTTNKRALDFVRRGIARIEKGKLLFSEENQIQRQAEFEFRKNRGNVLWWNGNSRDPRATYAPGQKRS